MSAPVLSILIATMEERQRQCTRLLRLLGEQVEPLGAAVQILTDGGAGTIGTKRQRLLERAIGEYVAFVDDDDLVSDDYISGVLAACAQGADCCSLRGVAVFDDGRRKPFDHSVINREWSEDDRVFYRTPNHLNAVRRELAVAAGFPDLMKGEDHEYSRRLYQLLRSEAPVLGDAPLYHYFAQPRAKARARSLRFLIKWPTRGRPKLFSKTLRTYVENLSGRNPARLVVSVDADDDTAGEVRDLLGVPMVPGLLTSMHVGPAGRTKIQVINDADIGDTSWDVLLLVADDMVAVEKDFDERIVVDFAREFPDLDGLLVYEDGFQKAVPEREIPVATMPVMGRPFYDRQGYIYHPEYTSLWCDQELTDVAKVAGRAVHVRRQIIRHDWIGKTHPQDPLLKRNEATFKADKEVYERRKAVGFPRGSSLPHVSYSQNDEEETILREISAVPGRFLDVGAHDGQTLSNTRRLAELGWTGVLVEPAPKPFAALLERYGGDAHMVLINAAVAAQAGWTTFADSGGDLVSTLSDAHAARWGRAGIKWGRYLVRAVTPAELLHQVGLDFAFVSLDVEGTNLAVFQAIPWFKLSNLRLICVEHDGAWEEMASSLSRLGFEPFYRNAENVMFRRA